VSAGRWHHSIVLPGGEKVTADYREPVTMVMHRVASAWSDGRDPELSDLGAIAEWGRQNRQMVEACQRGDCDHVVV
jgi:hypothetical protein